MIQNRFQGRRPPKKEELHAINEKIRSHKVRLVGEGVEQGVYLTVEALRMAREMGVDLVEISPNADPPVCKLVDYKKFLYELKKKQKDIKSKTKKVVVKEVRFGPHTQDHDFNFKKNQAIEFLKEGNKVKASVQFRGREIVFKDQGEMLLLRFAQELENYGKAESLPSLEGKRMHIVIGPKKKS